MAILGKLMRNDNIVSRLKKNINPSTNIVDQSTEILARAFLTDLLFMHAFPDEKTRLRLLLELFRLNFNYGFLYGDIYFAEGRGVSIWLPPDNYRITFQKAITAGMLVTPLKIGLRGVFRLGRINSVSEIMHARFAPDRHWYLFLLGVDPLSQGMGWGRKIIQPVLDQADSDRLPCYLETNNYSAVLFYKKLGFDIVAEENPKTVNFPIWGMRRENR